MVLSSNHRCTSNPPISHLLSCTSLVFIEGGSVARNEYRVSWQGDSILLRGGGK